MKRYCLPWLLAVMANTAHALNSEHGPFYVSSLHVAQNALSIRLDPAPTGCGGGDNERMHLRIMKNSASYDAIYAALTTAYTARTSIKWIWYVELPEGVSCSDGAGILTLNAIELTHR